MIRNILSNLDTNKIDRIGISNIYSIRIKIRLHRLQMMIKSSDVLSQVNFISIGREIRLDIREILGEAIFEKEKSYPHYHRNPKEQSRRSLPSPVRPPTSDSDDVLTEITSNILRTPLRRRAKRQHDIDPTAKHVEVLVAYDESIREFHSDADIKSYILTLFSYVSSSPR